MQDHVTVFEVGPRDGLQNEANLIPARDKISLTDMLSETGLSRIEVTSFVSPKWVPQMGDAAEVMAGISRKEGVRYAVLTPNLRGLEGAIAAKASEVAIFLSASEGFSKANINATMAESVMRAREVASAAMDANMPVRGYVSCVTDCPYDGPTPPHNVAFMAEALLAMGCYEVSLGDTIGKAVPRSLTYMLDSVLAVARPDQLAGHFHDTDGHALANVEVALDHGLRVFDSAVGGLGGCPYAPGAAGNVATEALVARLHALGYTTGIDLAKLEEAGRFAIELREGN
ncbi:hydroxymethylglutaryl-CoA lyase [Pontivivens insulae]|uniref:3-hydroxy-3-isohexenylglutaryl-CoA/hydroxy-methylglutaryl-CoA lyase n=1 Tax=Pontivivens insulae TaxID=1639689 RepID=A0A2R8AEF7_9RHOB|nr:hydroxymethylglutaryl-CoA lyase [Pontivivens insulae]RED11886.1 hydroxymethylglutaryl-CoA lyase [Pontivivens insulae]SPF30643.1 3-hydroxy-3-isohexenylglutaryl-CoA/hydroxy-methylglutaryl-CoA lyase [Pontivivens insulae]